MALNEERDVQKEIGIPKKKAGLYRPLVNR